MRMPSTSNIATQGPPFGTTRYSRTRTWETRNEPRRTRRPSWFSSLVTAAGLLAPRLAGPGEVAHLAIGLLVERLVGLTAVLVARAGRVRLAVRAHAIVDLV